MKLLFVTATREKLTPGNFAAYPAVPATTSFAPWLQKRGAIIVKEPCVATLPWGVAEWPWNPQHNKTTFENAIYINQHVTNLSTQEITRFLIRMTNSG